MNLLELHPEFKKKLCEFVVDAQSQGLDVGIQSGFRTFEEQSAIFNKKSGATKAKGGLSWHCYGLAADVIFKDKNGTWSWDSKHNWKKLGTLGKSHGLEWGGDWKSIKDLGHFQWTKGMTIRRALALHSHGGVNAVWNDWNGKI